jgi:hypothetical protein
MQPPFPGQPEPTQPGAGQPYPAQPYPGQPYPPGAYSGAMPQGTAPSATKALVFGLLGVLLCPILGFWGISNGKRTKDEVRLSGGRYSGEGLGIAGLILGWISVGLLLIIVVAFFAAIVTGAAQS